MTSIPPAKPNKDLFGSVPEGARGALGVLLAVVILKGIVVIFMAYLFITDRRPPPDEAIPWLITLFGVLCAMVFSAVAAIVLLYRKRRIGKFFAWIVVVFCLPGFPLFTLLGISLISGLRSPGMQQHLARA